MTAADPSLMKAAFGLVSGIVVAGNLLSYLAGVVRGQIRPHVFSWFIWALSGLVLMAAQYVAGAGPGMWGTVIGTILSFLIVGMAIVHRCTFTATAKDWAVFVVTLLAIPLWQLTANELYAVIICTAINAAGYYFTIRNVIASPRAESAGFYSIQLLRWLLTVLAMEQYSLSTLMYPAVSLLLNGATAALIVHLARKADERAEDGTK